MDMSDRIVAKSGVLRSELEDKVRKGFSKIEIQLFPYNTESEDTYNITLEDILYAVKELGLDIVNIHAPLCENPRTQIIESIVGLKVHFRNTLKLAQEIASVEEHPVNVVYHTELSEFAINDLHYTKSSIMLTMITVALSNYPNVNLSFENVTPTSDGNNCFCSGSYTENVKLCEFLRFHTGRENRFFTTFDVCHAVTTIRTQKILKEHGYEFGHSLSLGDFVEANMKYCNNVHFCNVEDLGFLPGQHGTANFTEEEFKEYMSEIKKLDPMAYITLEVKEDDYNNCINNVQLRNRILLEDRKGE